MKLKAASVWAVSIVAILTLSSCGGGESSTSDPSVQRVVKALDDLNIEHTDPVRAEVGLSGAKAIYDLTINGFDAGINIFADAAALKDWQELSDAFGGIHVAFDNAALSLDTDEGKSNSAEIAAEIADALGGTAHGD